MTLMTKRLLAACLGLGVFGLVGCGSPSGEKSEDSSAAMKSVSWCTENDCTGGYPTGSGGGGRLSPPECDPTSMCCVGGGESNANQDPDKCQQAIWSNGCVSINGTANYAAAVEMDGTGHWWFEVYCPPSAQSAVAAACNSSDGVHDYEWPVVNHGANCIAGQPPVVNGVQYVDVGYDPTCAGGCHIVL